MNKIYKFIFWLATIFITVTVISLTIGQSLPVEFRDNEAKSNYFHFVFLGLPIAILLTLTKTINKNKSKVRNWTAGILTLVFAGICFFLLVQFMFLVVFNAWSTEEVLYRKKTDTSVVISQQIYDLGAFGYGKRRTVQITPFLRYFQTVKILDSTLIDSRKWTPVNKEGDIKFP